MRKLIVAIFCFIAIGVSAQINCVTYTLEYSDNEDQYTVNLIVLDGEALSAEDRSQFNSNITIVVPSGQKIDIIESLNPIEFNHSLSGTIPASWGIADVVLTPEASPENDFYSTYVDLSPAAFFNEIKKGDIIPLFRFIIEDGSGFDENVRLFNNETDPGSLAPGMGGGNFSNTFRINASDNIYYSDLSDACITNTKELSTEIETIYPNPFTNILTISAEQKIARVQILDVYGKTYRYLNKINQKELSFNTSNLPSGVYVCVIKTIEGKTSSHKIIKH